MSELDYTAPRKAGRPRGSKNKPKDPMAPAPPKPKVSRLPGPGFGKGDPAINRTKPGPGRTAGYAHFLAKTLADLFDSSVSADDPTPFIEAATTRMKSMILAGNPLAMKTFMDRVALNPTLIDKLDDVLAGQKNKDVKFLEYQIFNRCFDKQQEVLMTKRPTALLICGRRSGKTETLASKIVQMAISSEKGDIVYIGKTYTSAYELIWKRVTDILDGINVPYKSILSEQTIVLNTGVCIYVRGANNLIDIDKLRGHSYRLAVVDECQGIKHLRLLIDEILRPALADYKDSQLFLSGTPPRTKGSHTEFLWEKMDKNVAKFHWDMSENMFLPDPATILQRKLEELNLTPDNPVYQREWLGLMGVYDVDALVFAPSVKNAFDANQLRQWVEANRPEDLYFSAGLDLGHSDSDAFVIILGSTKRPEKWLVYEHKRNKQGITELVLQVKAGIEYVTNHEFLRFIPSLKNMKIWTDSGGLGKKIAVELRQQYHLPTFDAIKTEKHLAIDLLREEVKAGRLKFDLLGLWADECEKIVFERDEHDVLTQEIDDSYHPDLMDALLYSMRPLWQVSKVKIGDEYEEPEVKTPIIAWTEEMKQARVVEAERKSRTNGPSYPPNIQRLMDGHKEDDAHPWD